MTRTQPLRRKRDVASACASRETALVRLLVSWAQLARRSAEAYAHGLPDWTSLQASQFRTEDALESRFPREWALLSDALIAWEGSLLHVVGDWPHDLCSYCRRASLEVPERLPLPAGVALDGAPGPIGSLPLS